MTGFSTSKQYYLLLRSYCDEWRLLACAGRRVKNEYMSIVGWDLPSAVCIYFCGFFSVLVCFFKLKCRGQCILHMFLKEVTA